MIAKKAQDMSPSPAGISPAHDVSHAKDSDKDEEVHIELSDEPQMEEVVFTLPMLPGATNHADIEVEPEIEVEEPKDVEVEEKDPWDWQSGGVGAFTDWLRERLDNLPTHTGKEIAGCERVISIMEALDKEISKAMRSDYHGVIDSGQVEGIREEIQSGIERLSERLEKLKEIKYKGSKGKKKKASEENEEGLVKEAGTTKITGISITVPLFISAVVRTMINGFVSSGHSIDSTFEHFDTKYKFTPREHLEVQQLLFDSGFPMARFDRGLIGDKEVNYDSSNNYDLGANYKG